MTIYLFVCLFIFIAGICFGIYEDIKHGPDLKFGYNYQSGLSWGLLLLVSVPFVNILTLISLCYFWFRTSDVMKDAKS